MGTPSADNEFLHELEVDVKMELTVAETGQPEHEEEVEEVAGGESPLDLDEQRYETSLRSLLGAIEAVEDGSGPGGQP